MRRYLCFHFPRLATDRLRQKTGAASGPLATVARSSNTSHVAAVDRKAASGGAAPGMTLASARAVLPTLKAVPEDPEADHALLEDLARWAERFSPLVALEPSGDGLMLDITGCAHLFESEDQDGEGAMIRTGLDGFAARGIEARAAIANASGAAAILARCGGAAEIIIPPGRKLTAVLAPLPVTALGVLSDAIGPPLQEGLYRVGFRRIGDLIGKPRASLAARFGTVLCDTLDQALGHAPRPIDPKTLKAPYRVRLRFPDPIGASEDIDEALNRLLGRMCQRLADEGRGVRKLDWVLYRSDGGLQQFSIGTARPLRNAARLFRLFEEKRATLEPGYGIDSMLLSAPIVEDAETDQAGFGGLDHGMPAGDGALDTFVDRISNRLGADNVFRLTPVDSHLPDRAQTRAAAIPGKGGRSTGTPLWPSLSDRPIKLLNAPHPIEPLGRATAAQAPDAFRIFGRRLRMRILRGPERIAPEWWRKDALWATGARDYFDVEEEGGRRFWIYRDNATGPIQDQRWYLHGLF